MNICCIALYDYSSNHICRNGVFLKRLRHIIALLMCAIMLIPMTACQKEESNAVVDITLNEVAHSIFYAPQYAAIELGYFKDENINLNLVTGFGADKVMTALVSGDADKTTMPSTLPSLHSVPATSLYQEMMKVTSNGMTLREKQYLAEELAVCRKCFLSIFLRKTASLL